MRLTREQLNNAATEMGGYTRAHMMALGEPWPLTSGWKLKILEKDFDQSAIDLFMSFSEKSKAVAFRKSQRKAAKKSRKKQAFKLYTSAENYGVSRRSKKKVARQEHRAPEYSGNVNSLEFLHSYEWRQLRIRVLVRYGRKCMCCGATQEGGSLMHVDHIKPRRLFPHLALDEENLQILCEPCNHGKGNQHGPEWDFRPKEEYVDPEVLSMLRDISRM